MAFLTGTNLIGLALAAAAVFFFVAGVRALRLGSRTIYFRHRRQRVLAGWWMTGASLLLAAVAALMLSSRTPVAAPEPPTSTPQATTMRASDTSTSPPPTRTPIPSPAATFTPSSTATPHLPLSLEIMVVSSITPQPEATITDVRFSETLPGGFAVGNRFEWPNPIRRMYASFSYRNMTYGVQFTALWFRNGELVFFESGPWQLGGRGGSASLWQPAPHEWHPGVYEVQFFVGTQWKATGRFTVTGEPPAPTATPTSTFTLTPRPTWTSTALPSETPRATSTALPTATPTK